MTQYTLHDQGAAFLTAGLIAKSDKIQSTRFTLELWNDMREKLSIESRFDYLVAILAYGQVMDRRIPKGDHFEFINDSINNIREELIISLTQPILGEKKGTKKLAEVYFVKPNDAASALLTAAYTSVSQKVESTKEVIEIWKGIRAMELVEDNNQFLTALLASSRLNDLKQMVDNGSGIDIIMDNFRTLVETVEPDIKVSKIDLVAAHLTVAIVSQSIEIESNNKVLDIWKKMKNEIPIKDNDQDLVTSILASGMILNRTMKLDLNDIQYIFINIKSKLPEYKN